MWDFNKKNIKETRKKLNKRCRFDKMFLPKKLIKEASLIQLYKRFMKKTIKF